MSVLQQYLPTDSTPEVPTEAIVLDQAGTYDYAGRWLRPAATFSGPLFIISATDVRITNGYFTNVPGEVFQITDCSPNSGCAVNDIDNVQIDGVVAHSLSGDVIRSRFTNSTLRLTNLSVADSILISEQSSVIRAVRMVDAALDNNTLYAAQSIIASDAESTGSLTTNELYLPGASFVVADLQGGSGGGWVEEGNTRTDFTARKLRSRELTPGGLPTWMILFFAVLALLLLVVILSRMQ